MLSVFDFRDFNNSTIIEILNYVKPSACGDEPQRFRIDLRSEQPFTLYNASLQAYHVDRGMIAVNAERWYDAFNARQTPDWIDGKLRELPRKRPTAN